MSAASRAREEEARKKLEAERYKDLPEPGFCDEPDPEFDRLMGWFVQNRKELAEHLNCDRVIVDGNDGILLIGKRRTIDRIKPVMTIKYGPNGELIQ